LRVIFTEIAIVVLMFNIGYTKDLEKAQKTPESLIFRIYKEHQPQNDKIIAFDNKISLQRYFTPEVTELFLHDEECKKKTQGICNLDFDPFFDAQDVDNSPLNLKVEKNGTTLPLSYKVTFFNINSKMLIYQFVQTGQGWRCSLRRTVLSGS